MIQKENLKLKEIISRSGDYFLFFVIIILSLSLFGNIKRIREADAEISKAQINVENISRENQDIQNRLETMRSETFIEKQLRDTLGLAKEGEIIVILPDDEIVRKFAPEVEEVEDVLPDPNWRKWAKLFL
jgi:cell division protein FtsB